MFHVFVDQVLVVQLFVNIFSKQKRWPAFSHEARCWSTGFIWSWSWFGTSCFTNPLRKASFDVGSGLKLFPLQILTERLHLRLELVWSALLHRSFKKVFIWGWICNVMFKWSGALHGYSKNNLPVNYWMTSLSASNSLWTSMSGTSPPYIHNRR